MAKKKSDPVAAAATEEAEPQKAVAKVREESPGVIVRAGFERPFAAAAVKWKPQMVKQNRCLAIAYIDARLVMDRLDEVVGVAGWSDEYELLDGGSVMCRLTVRIGGLPVTKCDVGSPSEQPDVGDRMKAACSDALKRAAVKFGIGRYLYRIPNQWVDYDPVKKRVLSPPQLPAWALPKAPAENYSYHGEDHVPEPPEGQSVAATVNQAPSPAAAASARKAEEEFDKAFSAVVDLDDANALLLKAKALPEESKLTAWEAMKQMCGLNGWRFNQGTGKFEVDPKARPKAESF